MMSFQNILKNLVLYFLNWFLHDFVANNIITTIIVPTIIIDNIDVILGDVDCVDKEDDIVVVGRYVCDFIGVVILFIY